MNRSRLVTLTQISILVAIEAIVGFTPLGSLPAFGPIVATLAHLPVIIAALVFGPCIGALMGGVFGLFSFIVWTFMPPSPIAFVFTPFYSLGDFHGNFWSIVICFVPRILIGVVAGLSLKGFQKIFHGSSLPFVLSGFLGSITNTILVLAGIYFCFGFQYSQAIGTSQALLLGILGASILTNGIPEAILGSAAGVFIAKPLRKFNR